MVDEKTVILFKKEAVSENEKVPERPTLFVCQDRMIAEYRLQGYQNMGRPTGGAVPDIPVHSKFVSRGHGFFETEGAETYYTALQTTNGIKYKGEYVKPWTKIHLKDGDELVIPSGDEEQEHSVMLVYATTPTRIRLWRDLLQASRDKLTGLCGRDGFMLWWKQNHEKKDYSEAVFFIMDIDDFKVINDKMGHNAGDEALKVVSDQLRKMVRYENQVCRWGGDEFVGVIPGEPDKAETRLRALSHRIKEASASVSLPITVSIGYVDIKIIKDVKNLEGILELADRAMYGVKNTGKGGIARYIVN